MSPPPATDLPPPDDIGSPVGLTRLALLAALGGAAAGLVGGLFRWALLQADIVRTSVLDWTRDAPTVRWLVPLVLAAMAVGVARLIVRWVPEAPGSGIQRVEADMRAEVPAGRGRLVPAKFVGGVLSIGGGLALGREGPTVQMGAAIGGRIARSVRLSAHDSRTLTAALGGAGLGVAFSAPIGGAIFVFEEVARAFRTRLAIATLVGVAVAVSVAQFIVGSQPVFPHVSVDPTPLWTLVLFALMGVVLGALGVAYNWLIIRCMDVFDSISRVPPEVKAAFVGATVGLLGVAAPWLIGGGESLNEQILLGAVPLGTLALVAVVRWFLGPYSYATGTPGGLFAPLLLVGAALGGLLAAVGNQLVPAAGLSVPAFAIVGMSTFFAGVVRAPITGVALIVEMTATTSLLVPMMLAAACAVVCAGMLRGEPIYDTLRLRMQRGDTLPAVD